MTTNVQGLTPVAGASVLGLPGVAGGMTPLPVGGDEKDFAALMAEAVLPATAKAAAAKSDLSGTGKAAEKAMNVPPVVDFDPEAEGAAQAAAEPGSAVAVADQPATGPARKSAKMTARPPATAEIVEHQAPVASGKAAPEVQSGEPRTGPTKRKIVNDPAVANEPVLAPSAVTVTSAVAASEVPAGREGDGNEGPSTGGKATEGLVGAAAGKAKFDGEDNAGIRRPVSERTPPPGDEGKPLEAGEQDAGGDVELRRGNAPELSAPLPKADRQGDPEVKSENGRAAAPVKTGEATALLSIARHSVRMAEVRDAGSVANTPVRATPDRAVSPAVPGRIAADVLTTIDPPKSGLAALPRHLPAGTSTLAVAAAQFREPSPVRLVIADPVVNQVAVPEEEPKAENLSSGGASDPSHGSAGRVDGARPAASAQAIASFPPPVAAPSSAAPVADLSGALGRQVVNLGVSGQWIEGISREIASIAANPGHGRFSVASPGLGAVQVEIAPGKSGSRILMQVDSDAAQAALKQESDRLIQDARLASIRIGEVRIERVSSPAEAQRGESGNGQQQGSGGNTPSQGMSTQSGGNNGQHGARPDASTFTGEGQGGNNPKASLTRAVLHDTAAVESAPARGRRPDTARYA